MSSPSTSTSNNKFIVHTVNDPGFKPMRDFVRIREHYVSFHPSHFQLTNEEFQKLLKHPAVARRAKRSAGFEINRNQCPVTWIIKQGDLERKIERLIVPVVTKPAIICYWPSQSVMDNVPEPIAMQDPRPPRVSPGQKRPSPSMEIVEKEVIVIDDDDVDDEDEVPPLKKMIYFDEVVGENHTLKDLMEVMQKELMEQRAKFDEYQKAMEKRFEKMEQRLVREIECFNRDVSDVRGEFKAEIAHINRNVVFREIPKPVPAASATGKNQKTKK